MLPYFVLKKKAIYLSMYVCTKRLISIFFPLNPWIVLLGATFWNTLRTLQAGVAAIPFLGCWLPKSGFGSLSQCCQVAQIKYLLAFLSFVPFCRLWVWIRPVHKNKQNWVLPWSHQVLLGRSSGVFLMAFKYMALNIFYLHTQMHELQNL